MPMLLLEIIWRWVQCAIPALVEGLAVVVGHRVGMIQGLIFDRRRSNFWAHKRADNPKESIASLSDDPRAKMHHP